MSDEEDFKLLTEELVKSNSALEEARMFGTQAHLTLGALSEAVCGGDEAGTNACILKFISLSENQPEFFSLYADILCGVRQELLDLNDDIVH